MKKSKPFIKNNINLIKSLGRFIAPILYLIIWVLIIKFSKDVLVLQIDSSFLLITLAILFFGIISKSTSWSIGHEKFGIKADSTSKKVEFCADGIGTIKIFDDDLETRERLIEKAGEVIKNLRKNET